MGEDVSRFVGKHGRSIRKLMDETGLHLNIREAGDCEFNIHGWLLWSTAERLLLRIKQKSRRQGADAQGHDHLAVLLQALRQQLDRGSPVVKVAWEKIRRKSA